MLITINHVIISVTFKSTVFCFLNRKTTCFSTETSAYYFEIFISVQVEYAKFRGSHAIMGLVPSFHRVFVGPKFFPWVQNFFRVYFVSLKLFLVGIACAQNFFS